jgi:hypothetical protein
LSNSKEAFRARNEEESSSSGLGEEGLPRCALRAGRLPIYRGYWRLTPSGGFGITLGTEAHRIGARIEVALTRGVKPEGILGCKRSCTCTLPGWPSQPLQSWSTASGCKMQSNSTPAVAAGISISEQQLLFARVAEPVDAADLKSAVLERGRVSSTLTPSIRVCPCRRAFSGGLKTHRRGTPRGEGQALRGSGLPRVSGSRMTRKRAS